MKSHQKHRNWGVALESVKPVLNLRAQVITVEQNQAICSVPGENFTDDAYSGAVSVAPGNRKTRQPQARRCR